MRSNHATIFIHDFQLKCDERGKQLSRRKREAKIQSTTIYSERAQRSIYKNLCIKLMFRHFSYLSLPLFFLLYAINFQNQQSLLMRDSLLQPISVQWVVAIVQSMLHNHSHMNGGKHFFFLPGSHVGKKPL